MTSTEEIEKALMEMGKLLKAKAVSSEIGVIDCYCLSGTSSIKHCVAVNGQTEKVLIFDHLHNLESLRDLLTEYIELCKS